MRALRVGWAGPRHLAGRPDGRRWPFALAACLLAGGLLGAAGSRLAQGGAAAGAVPPASSTAVPAGRAAPASPRSPGAGPSSARTCLAAVEQADAVISYLIGDVRDRRLDTSLLAYVKAANDCRKETAS